MAGCDPSTVFDADGLVGGLELAIAERTLDAEMDDRSAAATAAGGSTCRHDRGNQTVPTATGEFEIRILSGLGPRDRRSIRR